MTDTDWTRDELLAALEWQVAFGADECIGDEAVDSYAQSLAAAKAAEEARQQRAAARGHPAPGLPPQSPGNAPAPRQARPAAASRPLQPLQQTLEEAARLAAAAQNLSELADALHGFNGCSLKKTAMNTLFGEGPAEAEVMIVTGAPRAEEDREGRAIAGVNRVLLENMLKSIGLSLEAAYLTPSLFWRPPGDKKPVQNDLLCCKPFVERQIALVRPKLLLLMGETALRGLIDPDAVLLRQRGKWLSYPGSMPTEAPKVLATLPPHLLISQPRQKALAWQDLRLLKKAL